MDLLVIETDTRVPHLFITQRVSNTQSTYYVDGIPTGLTAGNTLYRNLLAAQRKPIILTVDSASDAEDLRIAYLSDFKDCPSAQSCIDCLIKVWKLPPQPVIRKNDFITLKQPADADERTKFFARYWCWVIGTDPEYDRVALSCANRMGAVSRACITRIQRISKYHPKFDFKSR